MAREIVVTRGNQITLTKTEREKSNIKEGDRVLINLYKDTIYISKKNPNVFDDFNSFLPKNFDKILGLKGSDNSAVLSSLLGSDWKQLDKQEMKEQII